MKDTDIFRALCALRLRLALLAVDESGMSTVEYSIVEYYTRRIPDRAGGHVDAARPGWITS